jgi:hypothetical protein
MTGGVSTTTSAKLNSSASFLETPASNPVEIVAPDRENPLKGRQIACTAPIHADSLNPTSLAIRRPFSIRPENIIKTPTTAREIAMRPRFPNIISTCACGVPRRKTFSIISLSTSPIVPVKNVATITRKAKLRKAAPDLK